MNESIAKAVGPSTVNTNLKLCAVMFLFYLLVINLFMTTGLCGITAAAVSESLLEGNADYCMIVCD